MKRIDLKPYNIKIIIDGKAQERSYDVKQSVIELLFSTGLMLNGERLLQQQKTRGKVDKATDEVILEDEEYETLKKAVNLMQGLSLNDVEMVKRVLEAPDA